MKKLKLLLVVLLTFLVVPFGVFAEEDKKEDKKEEKTPVTAYLFWGDGCGFCANLKAWLAEIEDEHGYKFDVVDYEIYKNQENNELMGVVSEARGENATGIPYLIIGNQSWEGFNDGMKQEILEKIDIEYEKDVESRYDVMDLIEWDNEPNVGRDIFVTIVIIAVVAGLGGMIYSARKNTN